MKFLCYDELIGKEIARELLEIEAIKLQPAQPFTWASGWKSPIYCDNRLSLSFPSLREKIKLAFVDLIRQYYPETEAIAGVATAGIPQGALVADAMELPFIYVRSSSKSHGLTNQIEGKVIPGQRVVVLEDLVSTGGSSLAAVEALQTAGVDIVGMTAIFTYGFPQAAENFRAKNIDLVYLSEYNLLIDSALRLGTIDPDTVETLGLWRQDPANWSI